MSQIKCTHCDGLGHFYNYETFQTEHCPHCEGKGYIESNNEPIDVPEMPLVVEEPVVVEAPVVAPKPTKKSTKTVVEAPVEPQADEIATDGQPE